MSNVTCEAGSRAIAMLTHSLASKAIMSSSDNIAEGLAVGLSAAAPVVMLVAGMVSKAFYDANQDKNPAAFAADDSILFAALLLARATLPSGNGCAVQVSPEGFADTITDFGKLKPLVSIDAVIRPDMLEAARRGDGDGNALLAGILSKTSH